LNFEIVAVRVRKLERDAGTWQAAFTGLASTARVISVGGWCDNGTVKKMIPYYVAADDNARATHSSSSGRFEVDIKTPTGVSVSSCDIWLLYYR